MNTPPVVHPRPRFRTKVDHASVALLRSAMADDCRPEKASRELLATVQGDPRVLVLMRAKLSRAALERPTRITERAMVILRQALAAAAEQATVPAAFPRQGGSHA